MAHAYSTPARSRSQRSRHSPSARQSRPRRRVQQGRVSGLTFWLPAVAFTAYVAWLAVTVAWRRVAQHPLVAPRELGAAVMVMAVVVVCVAALWVWLRLRQAATMRRRQAERLAALSAREALRSLPPTQFESVVADLLRHQGYRDVLLTGGAGDLAADIVCRDVEGARVVVQCKRYSSAPVTSPEMQAFIGMIYVHHRADYGLYVTTSTFTRAARALAEQHNIRLITGMELAESIRAWSLAVA